MENFSKRTLLDRLKLELRARGISLRKLDVMLPEGKRQIFQPSRDRSLDLDDVLTILKVADIEPAVFFGQVAGFGHPLEIGALRGGSGPTWTKIQTCTLKMLRESDKRGARGFHSYRNRLRELECLRENEPSRAETETWAALTETEEPGALVGLLSMLAIHASRAQSYYLLELAIELLGGELKSAAGAKLATASGRCFIKASLVREGLNILENFALPLAARHGAAEDHAAVLILISHAEAALGLNSTEALRKAIEVGDERQSFAALQLIAVHELNLGDVEQASQMYDNLVKMPYFQVAPRVAKAAISCSRLTAHFLAGHMGPESVGEFRQTVANARSVLAPRDQVAALLDFVLFLTTLGRNAEAQEILKGELWKVLDLEDRAVKSKFANLWVGVGLPKDSRLQMLLARDQDPAENRSKVQPPGSHTTPASSSAASGTGPNPRNPSKMSQRLGSLGM